MPVFGYFGIESSGLNLVVDLLILFVVVLYLSLIYWTYADARRRIEDPMLIGCATAAALFPFVGSIVYMILRPPEYLEDVRERELETRAAEARLREAEQRCPHCDTRVERDFVRCPGCTRKLKDRCATCSRPLERSWTICPYCEAEVIAPPAARRAGRRRATAQIETASEISELHEAAADGVADGVAELPELTGAAATEAARTSRRPAEDTPPAPLASSEAARRARGARGARPSGRPRPSP
jgi:Double zinc ribbon